MEYRPLGRTDLRVSAVGYGCGSVGGLMIRGDRDEMTRAVARAIDAGINYFDTARLYGNGQSETTRARYYANCPPRWSWGQRSSWKPRTCTTLRAPWWRTSRAA